MRSSRALILPIGQFEFPEAPPLHSAVVRESEVEREKGREAILRSLGARAGEISGILKKGGEGRRERGEIG